MGGGSGHCSQFLPHIPAPTFALCAATVIQSGVSPLAQRSNSPIIFKDNGADNSRQRLGKSIRKEAKNKKIILYSIKRRYWLIRTDLPLLSPPTNASNAARRVQSRKAIPAVMKMRTGLNRPSFITKKWEARIFTRIGPRTRSPRFRVLGNASATPPAISRTLTKSI
jgi:hypothetical protein